MSTPVAIPAQRGPALDHRARQVPAARRYAPSCGSVASTRSSGDASHRRTANQHMTLCAASPGLANQPHELVSGPLCADSRTGLVVPARPVHLSRGDARKPHAWSFGAPDRTIAVPYLSWGAFEGLAGRNDRNCGEEEKAHRPLYGSHPMPSPSRSRHFLLSCVEHCGRSAASRSTRIAVGLISGPENSLTHKILAR